MDTRSFRDDFCEQGLSVTFKVMSERCNQCLYGPAKIVSNRRRAEILREIDYKDSYFICHKASMADQKVACKGDWDQRCCGQFGRIAGMIGMIEFVDEATLSSTHQKDPA